MFNFQSPLQALTKTATYFGISLSEERLEMYLIGLSIYPQASVIKACESCIYNEERFPTISKIIDTIRELKDSGELPADDGSSSTVYVSENENLPPDLKRIKEIIDFELQEYDGPKDFAEYLKEWHEDCPNENWWKGILTDEELVIARKEGWLL